MSHVRIGDALPELDTGPITRHRIALYAHGSGDLNAIHVDSDFAREKAGLPDVVVHGMFSMGCLSRVVTNWAGPGSVRSVDTRFEAMLPVMESLRCTGTVTAIDAAPGGALVTIALAACRSDGQRVASGTAIAFKPGLESAA